VVVGLVVDDTKVVTADEPDPTTMAAMPTDPSPGNAIDPSTAISAYHRGHIRT
jgi:hypothetical protein